MSARLSVCVYCGSRTGRRPAYAAAADAVGRWIGREGAALVYGGAQVGLMGRVADAALAAGARVTGVIPNALQVREVGHSGLHELLVVDSMHERKRLMAERSNVFLALPGGIGTLEELFETWTWRQLGYHERPIGLLNIEGCYDLLLQHLDRNVEDGFLDSAQVSSILVDTQAESLLERLADEHRRRGTQPPDYAAT